MRHEEDEECREGNEDLTQGFQGFFLLSGGFFFSAP